MASWMSVKTTAQYLDTSDKTVRRLLKHGLPYCRLPSGTIRVHQEKADEFFQKFEVREKVTESKVDEILEDLGIK